MLALLNPKVWIAIALAAILAASHFAAYRSGKANVRQAWEAEKGRQATELAQFNEENRRIENKRQTTVLESVNAAKARETTLRRDAAGAQSELARLRDSLASPSADLSKESCTASNQRASTVSELLQECAGRYSDLAGKADRIASERQTLIDGWPK